ncbi:4-amino-4-deoxy-L-arabinose transferase-like glycosyltransferase [Arthrobacter sp. UYCu512]
MRGFGFRVPALILPLLLLGAAAGVFLLGSGAVAVILGSALLLGAVSSLIFYSAGIRRRRNDPH